MVMQPLIDKLKAGNDLTPGDISYAVAVLLSNAASDDLKAEFLTALHHKGESADEIAGFVRQLVDRAIDPQIDQKNLPGPLLDVCGTGGDGLDLFNVSTTIMFILAAGGAVVAKHGNRSVTSLCGSADVLEALGVRIDLQSNDLKECIERLGFGFIFARKYHPAFRALAEMRIRLARQKTRTIFNLLGPLLNPVRPPRQLIGVYGPRLTNVFAEVLRRLGAERAWIVHGLVDDGAGMDDISTSGPTTVAELAGGKIISGVIDANWLGIPRAPIAAMRGGDAAANAATLLGILSGEITDARRDLAIVNAAGGFVVADLAQDMNEGIARAREQIESGRALAKLRELQNFQPARSG
ncbi:MAG: anthranilate phosphoribosyltransferase [Verrucomicrobiota bacterium]